MSPAALASLINGGLAVLEAIRLARAENPELDVGIDLTRRMRAEVAMLSEQLSRDIEAELERRLALEERAEA